MINLEIKKIAEDKAEGIYHRMCMAAADPTLALNRDEARIYQELKEWGWFDHFPLDDEGEQITRLYLSMTKYAKLKWREEHPVKDQRTKWEKVTGKAPKKR